MTHIDTILRALRRGPVESLELARLLWADGGPEWADANLRQNVWRLNRLLEADGWAVRSRRRYRARGTYELVRIKQRGLRMADDVYLIWSNEHRGWWRPQRRGYTRDLAEAGRYDRDTALRICHGAILTAKDIGIISELPVRLDDVMNFLNEWIFGGGKVPAEITSGLGGAAV